MKKLFISSIIIAMLLCFSIRANAALEHLGQGTSTHGTWNLIYDTDLDITWYDYSSYGQWQSQVDWASGLSVSFGSNTYTDWRLPTTVDGPYVWGYDGTTTGGYNITSSEMGHLFYTGLGNKGYYATDGTYPQPGYGLTNTGDFQNLQANEYWSGTEYADAPNRAWLFHFYNGYQNVLSQGGGSNALAVRPGLAVVPEPISSILFVTGGTLLAGRRYLKRKKKA